jgi:hypothetical protein
MEVNMIKWLMRRWLTGFKRQWKYDAAYMHEVLDADPRAFRLFAKAIALGHYRRDVPLAPHFAAGIVALMTEDCGPCTQLTIDMAEHAGVDPAVLRAIVARDFDVMPTDVALAARFTAAALQHAPEADALREEVVERWGKRGLISLSYAMLAARMYPTLKYALGHGKSCTRLRVGGAVWTSANAVSRAA